MSYGNRLVDPRYRYRRETLYRALEPLIPAGLLPSMRAIIPDELAQERREARDRARHADSYTGQGVRCSNVELREEAIKMRSQGLPVEHISQTLGVGVATIYRWTRHKSK